jgi:endoglucanase Acf2
MRLSLRVALSALFVCAIGFSAFSQIVTAGKGSYTTSLPSGCKTPQDSAGVTVTPQTTADFTQPVISNKWWSSFLYKRVPLAHHNSGKSYPHPLSIRGCPSGLELAYTTTATNGMAWEWQWAGGTYEYAHDTDIIVGIDGLNQTVSRAAAYSDWGCTADWTSGSMNLRATMMHGNPYVFFKITGGNAKVACNFTPTVWYNQGAVLGITVNGNNWGIFAPTGSTWTQSGNNFTSTLSGKDYLSVAILPDNLTTTTAKTDALTLFTAHAYAFVTTTRADWVYDEKNAFVITTYTSTTQVKEGTETNTLQALFRHQWMHTSSPLTSYTYSSARGGMKLYSGNVFTTTMPFHGILPVFPDKGFDHATLTTYVNNETGSTLPSNADTYAMGKAFGRMAMLTALADQVANTTARSGFVSKMESKLQSWFTATSGKTSEVFYLSSQWNCLFGYPASYYTDTEINDHHFHYGYFIMAAASIAQFDPTWASNANWGPMVDMLIKDVANTDETSTMFPRMRNFDVYEGHGWAHGSEYYGRGNNQESSSESMNFNAALYLYGLFTKNKAYRDLGIFLYTLEALAIEQYWFDVNKAIFPSFYPNPCLGQVMSNGGSYHTFFGDLANYVHCINFLPLTTGSVYLGRNPAYMVSNINFMYNQVQPMTTNNGHTGVWDDVAWGALAFGDPAGALTRFGNFGSYSAFDGESKAHIYEMVESLNAMGLADTVVRADVPTFSVFDKGTTRTYTAYNPDDTTRVVKFTDGTSITVPSKTQVTTTGTIAVRRGTQSAFFVPVRSRGTITRTATGCDCVLRAVQGERNFAIVKPNGETIFKTMSGALPSRKLLGNGIYIVRIKQ